jgi:hypothetical protein
MKAFWLLITVVCFSSCSERGRSAIEEKLKTSDSVVVQFYGEKQVLRNAATSTDLSAINQLIKYVDGDQADSFACAKSGQLIFYSNKKELQRVHYKTACNQFEFTLNGKKQFTKMPAGSVNYINSIEAGER